MLKVSIVIPTIGRGQLSNCLRRLAGQTYKNYEVLVIEDGKGTKWIQNDVSSYDFRYFCTGGRCGSGAARNIGIRNSSGDVIVFVDDDVIVQDHKFLQEYVEALEYVSEKDSLIAGVGGVVKFPEDSSDLVKAIYYLPWNDEETCKLLDSSKGFYTDHLSCTSSCWWKCKLEFFDERLIRSQDLEMCGRVKDKGFKFYKIRVSPVFHHYRASLNSFFKQSFVQGTGGGMLLKKRPEQFSLFQKIVFCVFPAYVIFCVFIPWLLLLPLLCCRSGAKSFKYQNNLSLFFKATMLEYVKYYLNLAGMWKEIIKKG